MIVFSRLAASTFVGKRVRFDTADGRGEWGTVDTAKVAEDLRDAKCTVRMDGWTGTRDYSGERGPVPTAYPSWRAMSWQEAAELRPHVDRLRRMMDRRLARVVLYGAC